MNNNNDDDNNNNNKGYIYCLSNKSMVGIVKVGRTQKEGRTPPQRAKELYTTGVPTPFTIEFAKKVSDPKKKEKMIHILLSKYYERVNSGREFFRVSPEGVKEIFNLLDGEIWVNEEEEQEEEKEEKKWCRDMSKCFTHGQSIRHKIGNNNIWIGKYDSGGNCIIHNEIIYKYMSGFVNGHHKNAGTYKNNGVSGWKEGECFVKNQWVSTYFLTSLI